MKDQLILMTIYFYFLIFAFAIWLKKFAMFKID